MLIPVNRFYVLTLFCLIAGLLTACGGAAPSPTPAVATATPPPSALILEVTAETLPMLVVAEREASIQGNLPLLSSLWAEDARIVDGRGSTESGDDSVWAGRAAILDRYVMAVFPAPPPPLTLSELDDAALTVEGDRATLINDGDRWRFVLRDGRWWLHELVYSLPSR